MDRPPPRLPGEGKLWGAEGLSLGEGRLWDSEAGRLGRHGELSGGRVAGVVLWKEASRGHFPRALSGQGGLELGVTAEGFLQGGRGTGGCGAELLGTEDSGQWDPRRKGSRTPGGGGPVFVEEGAESQGTRLSLEKETEGPRAGAAKSHGGQGPRNPGCGSKPRGWRRGCRGTRGPGRARWWPAWGRAGRPARRRCAAGAGRAARRCPRRRRR